METMNKSLCNNSRFLRSSWSFYINPGTKFTTHCWHSTLVTHYLPCSSPDTWQPHSIWSIPVSTHKVSTYSFYSHCLLLRSSKVSLEALPLIISLNCHCPLSFCFTSACMSNCHFGAFAGATLYSITVYVTFKTLRSTHKHL